MTVQLDFIGASGVAYRYVAREGQRVSPSGGNFVFVRETPEGMAVIYVGEAESLSALDEAPWAEAQSRFGATHAFVRLNVTAAIRRSERNDLLAAYDPPLNAVYRDAAERGPDPAADARQG